MAFQPPPLYSLPSSPFHPPLKSALSYIRPIVITGDCVGADGVVDAVEKATEDYKGLRTDGERFIDTYRRVGLEPFKEAIYG